MKTYSELKAKLLKIGFKCIEANYCGPCATLLHVGYGHNENPWPRHQVRVYRTHEQAWRGADFQFVDWLEVTDLTTKRTTQVHSLEQVWAEACKLAERALTPVETEAA